MDQHSDPGAGLNGALARTLNGERVAAHLTFADLATRTGISERQLIRLLSKMERTLNITVAEQIAEAVGLQLVEVLIMAEARLDREQRGAEGGPRAAGA